MEISNVHNIIHTKFSHLYLFHVQIQFYKHKCRFWVFSMLNSFETYNNVKVYNSKVFK